METAIYLMLGALLTLGGLVALNVSAEAERFDFPTLSLALSEMVAAGEFGEVTQFRIFGLLLFGFGILVALFPFHTWVPRAYAAAPSSLAMLHAGVLKKFGLYGLAQVALPLLPVGALNWSSCLIWLALANVLIVGFITMTQTDLRKMIGYASVMHFGYCFLGIGVLTALGVGSAVMLMGAHGFSVALMFLLAKYVGQRCGTFEMDEMGGLAAKTPVLACLFVGAVFAMIGLPGFGNFWGEFGIFMALGDSPETRFALGLASFGIVISGPLKTDGAFMSFHVCNDLVEPLYLSKENHDAQKLIASVDDIEAIAAEDEAQVPALQGWRREIFGKDALALKRGRIAVSVEGGDLQIIRRDD